MEIKTVNGGKGSTYINKKDKKSILLKDIKSVMFSILIGHDEYNHFHIEWNFGLNLKMGDDGEVIAIIVPDTLKMFTKFDFRKTGLYNGEVSQYLDLVFNPTMKAKIAAAGYEVEVYSMPIYRNSYGNSWYVVLKKAEN